MYISRNCVTNLSRNCVATSVTTICENYVRFLRTQLTGTFSNSMWDLLYMKVQQKLHNNVAFRSLDKLFWNAKKASCCRAYLNKIYQLSYTNQERVLGKVFLSFPNDLFHLNITSYKPPFKGIVLRGPGFWSQSKFLETLQY